MVQHEPSREVGRFARGEYLPGPDGRAYGALSLAEKLQVIQAHYAAEWATSMERAREIAWLEPKTRRVEAMAAAERELSAGDYEVLAAKVRVAWAQRRGA